MSERPAVPHDSPSEAALQLYRQLVYVRAVESAVGRLFAAGEVPGFIHLSIGQEAIAVGVCSCLERSDTISSHHRGHGHSLIKGMDLDRFLLEILGKEEGICRGRAGSMHLADAGVGIIGANGIIGSGLPISVGSALALQRRYPGAVAVAFFGDGALGEGSLHESMNIASLWRLPLLMVCENNGWAEFSPTAIHFKPVLVRLAEAYEIPALRLDGDDVFAVRAATVETLAAIRSGGGPRLLECVTHRQRGHFEGDPQRYRDRAEIEAVAAHDPLARCRRFLVTAGVGEPALEAIHGEIEARVAGAVERARAGSDPSFARARTDVFRNPPAARP